MKKDQFKCAKCAEVKTKKTAKIKYVLNKLHLVCLSCANEIDKRSGRKVIRESGVKVVSSFRIYVEDKVFLTNEFGSVQKAIDFLIEQAKKNRGCNWLK